VEPCRVTSGSSSKGAAMIGKAIQATTAIAVPIVITCRVLSSADSHLLSTGSSTPSQPSSSRIMLLGCEVDEHGHVKGDIECLDGLHDLGELGGKAWEHFHHQLPGPLDPGRISIPPEDLFRLAE